MNSKTASIIIGLAFLAIGVWGFVPNPIIGEHYAIFQADTTYNMVHIVSGLLFVFVALAMPPNAGIFCKVFGVVYLLFGMVGLIKFGTKGMGELFGFLHVNGADNFLHIGLGLIIFLTGMLKPKPAYMIPEEILPADDLIETPQQEIFL
jgi:hypothetical protein